MIYILPESFHFPLQPQKQHTSSRVQKTQEGKITIS